MKPKQTEKSNALDVAWELFQKNEYEKAIEESKNYLNSENIADRLESKKIIGLSHFRQKQYSDSEIIFKEISKYTETPEDWFNLATSATLNKNIELSEIAFNKAVEFYKQSGTKESISIPNMHCYYMQGLSDVGEFEKAFVHFEIMIGFYCQFSITDSHFLYMRGMPFFEHFLESSKPILDKINSEKVIKQLTKLKSKIDEYGKNSVLKLENELRLDT